MMLFAVKPSFRLPSGPVRNDEQQPVHHLAPILARSRDSRMISSTFPPIHFAMLPLRCVRLRCSRPSFHMNFPLYHALYYSSHPPSLIVWPKKESLRRTTNPRRPPSFLVAFNSVKKYFGLYGALSPTD